MTDKQPNMNTFKIQDGGRPPFKKMIFGYNSTADYPITVKFCMANQSRMAIEVTLTNSKFL